MGSDASGLGGRVLVGMADIVRDEARVSQSAARARGLQLGLGERRVLLIVGDLLAAAAAVAIALALWARIDYLGPAADG